MNIFCDFHHSGLAYSLVLLLEKRLGHTVYFPIGEEWYERGYWSIAEPYGNNPATIKQYLSLDQTFKPDDGTPALNTIEEWDSNCYLIKDKAHNYTRKAITWNQFQMMNIDIIIGSIPEHWAKYKILKDIYKPRAKVIAQVGNIAWEDMIDGHIQSGFVKNIMASTQPFRIPSYIKNIFYHQEIDQEAFKYQDPPTNKTITSFVIGLPRPDIFDEYKEKLPEFSFKAYGSSRNGFVDTIEEIANKMAHSQFAWHVKPAGDGFGHVWFDWAFVGRPIITNLSDYKDKLGGKIFQDGITGINLEARSPEQNVQLIREIASDTKRYKAMCLEINKRVLEMIDYAKEKEIVKEFLDNLV